MSKEEIKKILGFEEDGTKSELRNPYGSDWTIKEYEPNKEDKGKAGHEIRSIENAGARSIAISIEFLIKEKIGYNLRIILKYSNVAWQGDILYYDDFEGFEIAENVKVDGLEILKNEEYKYFIFLILICDKKEDKIYKFQVLPGDVVEFSDYIDYLI